MAKKKTAEKGEPKDVAKCDNLYGGVKYRLNEQVIPKQLHVPADLRDI